MSELEQFDYDTGALELEFDGTDNLKELVRAGFEILPPGEGAKFCKALAAVVGKGGEDEVRQMHNAVRLSVAVEQVDEILDRVRELSERDDPPHSSEYINVFRNIQEAADETIGEKKVDLLRNAAVNAFRPEFYDDGIVNQLFSTLEAVEYGDVFVLRRLEEQDSTIHQGELGDQVPEFRDTVVFHLRVLEDERLARQRSEERWVSTGFGRRFLAFVEEQDGEKVQDIDYK